MIKRKFIDFISSHLRKYGNMVKLLNALAQQTSPQNVILLDYPAYPKQRWDIEKPHQQLYDIINKNRDIFKRHLESFLSFSNRFTDISEREIPNFTSIDPHWINGYIPGLDGVALYSFIAINKPKYYLEVGSGNSTKFARKAITDHNLATKIISIDPHPRAEIDQICDEIIREPIENISIEIFDRLQANDILFIDNSHRVFMNSDATTVFLDVIPRLRSGVLVEIHDITLPYDYPAGLSEKYFAEQYLLASYLLAKGSRFDIVLPNTFVSYDVELKSILSPLWEKDEMKNVQTHGCSFWLTMQ